MDYITEPENKLFRHGPEVIQKIRKEYNLDKEERREEAIRIVEQWIKTQEHFIKKEYPKSYIEKSIITSKGSIERAKMQIDKMCTMRTLLPKYFQITNIQESELMDMLQKGYIGLVPQLTQELHRVIIIKIKPDANISSGDYTMLFKFFVIVAEYLKSYDYCQGFTIIGDCYDASAADVLSKVNLLELQQIIPLFTDGFGTKIKGIIFVTASKFIEGFVKLVKPFFSEKVANRIHVATTKAGVQEYIPNDILPEEYGGKGESVEVLHDKLVQSLSSKSHQELLKEMNAACTDESKRNRDKFNEKYMGMPGTFRTLSLD
ncbi:alpha-tocopherol transfer protein-like [Trichoplusia ni]|uniref:Alpha-tocopherol transfer protein-like n=1 Tax=Trichoplusia ni TaxID=7111 RepID=A0A7E5VII6_TRINI|nr:alpha-tocopherol transfer protein-like [Trichoplusia ni]XP_026728162.1 alpha-tocopherol transfer protein-like [Trichoplusia ni]